MSKIVFTNVFRAISVGAVLSMLLACGGGSETSSVEATPLPSVPLTTVTATYSREEVLEAASAKYLSYAKAKSPANGYPIADNGINQKWKQSSLRWSSGFFPGILWQLTTVSDDPEMSEQALRWTLPLDETADWDAHDVGFLIDNTFGKAGRINASTEYDDTRRRAADSLLNRYSDTVGATRSWDSSSDFLVIIDNMMNLALLFDAATTFSDERYYQAALTHALTTAREFLRNDGSSVHVVHFNEQNGEVVRKRTQQGLADDSTWSRGQAWGIYGFALTYRLTGETEALDSAIKLANFFVSNLPQDNVPLWDFDDTDVDAPKDTSASTIAAVGLWMLGEQLSQSEGQVYKDASRVLIDSLLNETNINIDSTADALLKHATGNKPGDFEVDVSLIYADYYLIEAILLQQEIIEWPL